MVLEIIYKYTHEVKKDERRKGMEKKNDRDTMINPTDEMAPIQDLNYMHECGIDELININNQLLCEIITTIGIFGLCEWARVCLWAYIKFSAKCDDLQRHKHRTSLSRHHQWRFESTQY